MCVAGYVLKIAHFPPRSQTTKKNERLIVSRAVAESPDGSGRCARRRLRPPLARLLPPSRRPRGSLPSTQGYSRPNQNAHSSQCTRSNHSSYGFPAKGLPSSQIRCFCHAQPSLSTQSSHHACCCCSGESHRPHEISHAPKSVHHWLALSGVPTSCCHRSLPSTERRRFPSTERRWSQRRLPTPHRRRRRLSTAQRPGGARVTRSRLQPHAGASGEEQADARRETTRGQGHRASRRRGGRKLS